LRYANSGLTTSVFIVNRAIIGKAKDNQEITGGTAGLDVALGHPCVIRCGSSGAWGEVLIGSDVEVDGVKESPIGLRRHVVALFVD